MSDGATSACENVDVLFPNRNAPPLPSSKPPPISTFPTKVDVAVVDVAVIVPTVANGAVIAPEKKFVDVA